MVDIKIIRLGLYMRCSTDNQELTLQEEELDKFVKRLKEDNQNNEYIITSYKDKGLSGKNTERPALQNMLNEIKKGNINCVMFTRLDRLARSLQDLLQITNTLKEFNCDFIVTQQQIDTSTAQGRLMFQIIGAFAEFERTMIIERMSGGRKKAEASGSKSGKPCHRPKKEIDEDGVVYKFKEGVSMNQIAKAYNISITPIRRILINRGLLKR